MIVDRFHLSSCECETKKQKNVDFNLDISFFPLGCFSLANMSPSVMFYFKSKEVLNFDLEYKNCTGSEKCFQNFTRYF